MITMMKKGRNLYICRRIHGMNTGDKGLGGTNHVVKLVSYEVEFFMMWRHKWVKLKNGGNVRRALEVYYYDGIDVELVRRFWL